MIEQLGVRLTDTFHLHGAFQSILLLMVIIYAAGHIFRKLNLPVIFWELLGGIILGPMLLNIVDPHSEIINILAELGVFFLMFHVGLENDPKEMFIASKKSILIAIWWMLVPILGGVVLGNMYGFPLEKTLFLWIIVSTAAIAISSRLIKDCKLWWSEVAHTTISAAVMNDILSLILFSVVITVAETGSFEPKIILIALAKIILFFGVIIFGGLKLSKHFHKIFAKKGFTFALIVALLLGLLAEAIGLHMIIGAFLAGLFIREEVLDSKIFHKIEDRIYGLSYSFLGPIFFTSLAFKLQIDGIGDNIRLLIGIVAIAIFGKIIGATWAAIIQKIKTKDAALIGMGLNSRGAVVLIIAAIGLEQGIIDNNLFSIIVIMAFASTLVSITGMKILTKKKTQTAITD